MNQRLISFSLVYNMSMFGEINHSWQLSFDVIVRRKYGPDTHGSHPPSSVTLPHKFHPRTLLSVPTHTLFPINNAKNRYFLNIEQI